MSRSGKHSRDTSDDSSESSPASLRASTPALLSQSDSPAKARRSGEAPLSSTTPSLLGLASSSSASGSSSSASNSRERSHSKPSSHSQSRKSSIDATATGAGTSTSTKGSTKESSSSSSTSSSSKKAAAAAVPSSQRKMSADGGSPVKRSGSNAIYKPAYPVVAQSSEWHVEEHGKELVDTPELVQYKHVYADNFASEAHLNFVLTQAEATGDKKETSAKAILTVARIPERSQVNKFLATGLSHRVLIQHESGFDETVLHNVPAVSDEEFPSKLEQFLRASLATKDLALFAVAGPDKDFKAELSAFEERHSRQVRHMKIAVLYARPGQTSMEQIWKNKPAAHSPLYSFLNSVATRIDLETWTGYRGDMGTQGLDLKTPAYHASWRGVEIIFHVAPWMTEEQHRRLCGNDVGVIVFFDTSDKPANAGINALSEHKSINRGLITEIFKQIILLDATAVQAMSKTFFKIFFEKAPEAKDYFDDTIGTAEWRMTESLKKMLDFIARVADDDASISTKSFSERRNFYGFLGLDDRIFDLFSAALISALKVTFADSFSSDHVEAWKYHLSELSKLCLGAKEYVPRVAPNFVPFEASAMGSVPQVFAVVEPHPNGSGHHRLGFFQRQAVGTYAPPSPPLGCYFPPEALADWLFSKFHNGFAKASTVPPFDRLFIVPRREAIKYLAEKFPKAKKKSKHLDVETAERGSSLDLSPSPKSRNMKIFSTSHSNLKEKDKARDADRERDAPAESDGQIVDVDRPLTESQKLIADLLTNPSH